MPTPETTSQPAVNDGKNSRVRIISWAVLCTVLILPLWLVVTVPSFTVVELAQRFLSPYDRPSFLPSSQLILTYSFVIAVILAVFLARRGIKRGWNTLKMLCWGWCIVALLTVISATGVFLVGRQTRRASIDQAVHSNARQLSNAADYYYLENTASTVSYDYLVGATNYVKAVNTIAGEAYPSYYTQGITITVTGVAGVRTITYAP